MKQLFSKQVFIFLLLLSTLFISNVYSNNPKLTEMLEISEIKIISFDRTDNVAVIEFKVTAFETFNGTLKFGAPNSVSNYELQRRTEEINLSNQSSEFRNVTIDLTENDMLFISLLISIPTAPEG